MLNVHSIETFGTHDGPGIRLVIFLQGCVFRCLYCSNPDTQAADSEKAVQMSAEEIIALLGKEKAFFGSKGGITFSGGEPTFQAKALVEVLKKIKAAGFHTAIDTCGGLYNPWVNQVYDEADLVLLDVKHIDPKWHKKITGADNNNVLKNAAYREKSGKAMWLKYVLVPGLTDQEEYLLEWAQYFKDFKTVERVEILPYHTLGAHKYKEMKRKYELEGVKPPNAEQIKKTKNIFSKYLKNVVVQ